MFTDLHTTFIELIKAGRGEKVPLSPVHTSCESEARANVLA